MNDTTAPTIRLQGWGLVPAATVESLMPGDVTIWNFGYRETVLEMHPSGKVSWRVKFRAASGYEGWRTMRGSRLVGIVR
jgi:hypothetical protein